MREWIKANRLSFKVGSFEWMIFFGLPTGLFIFGLMMLVFALRPKCSVESANYIISFIFLSASGVITYAIQLRKLRFKTFELKRDLEGFKKEVREILIKDNWEIEYVNKLFMQAVQRGSLLNLDMITLVFKERYIRWNVIHHPENQNSVAALLSFNRNGNRIIKQIKACAKKDRLAKS